jgi:hypothetical protein
MEDFGYQKDRDDEKSSNFNKKIFLILATIFSLSLFVYITITAYHFVYQDDENVELIKAQHLPIRVSMEEENNKNNQNIQIDRTIYEDIFGNKKEAGKIDNTKVVNTPETALPPKKEFADKNLIVEKNTLNSIPQNTTNNPINPDYNSYNLVKKNPNDEKFIIGESINNNTSNDLDSPANSNLNANISNNNFDYNNENIANNSMNAKLPKNEQRRKIVRVQIAAMSSKEMAEDHWKKLLRMNPELFVNLRNVIQKVDLGKRGIFYRLQIGEFFNQIEAENFCQKYISQTQKSKAECIVVE